MEKVERPLFPSDYLSLLQTLQRCGHDSPSSFKRIIQGKRMKIELDYTKKRKIVEKLMSIALTKISCGKKPRLRIPEFKRLLSYYKLKKSWFPVAKSLEEEGFLTLRGTRYVDICLSSETILRFYSLTHTPSSQKDIDN